MLCAYTMMLHIIFYDITQLMPWWCKAYAMMLCNICYDVMQHILWCYAAYDMMFSCLCYDVELLMIWCCGADAIMLRRLKNFTDSGTFWLMPDKLRKEALMFCMALSECFLILKIGENTLYFQNIFACNAVFAKLSSS